MDLNTICIGLLLIPVVYVVYKFYTDPGFIAPVMPKALWGEQVGKTKHIQSKTGDASLFTQHTRRAATKNGGFQRGFMSAAIDFFFISRICPCTSVPVPECQCKCCAVIDGGNPRASDQDLYDGGAVDTEFGPCTVDGGNVVHGQTCECCPLTDGGNVADIANAVYSGGGAGTVHGGKNIDGGIII